MKILKGHTDVNPMTSLDKLDRPILPLGIFLFANLQIDEPAAGSKRPIVVRDQAWKKWRRESEFRSLKNLFDGLSL